MPRFACVVPIGGAIKGDAVIPNNDEVICPNCCHQFRAIPVNVQMRMAELERARGADDKVANLATMVRRLARQLRIVLPSDQDHTLIGQAYGLLRKYGLQGSPLRDEYTEGEPAKPPEQPEKP
jgi:hypothetical protein